jgi:hypothetical protein
VTGHDASVLDQVRAAPACFGLLDSQAMIDLVACGRAQPIILVDRPPNQGGPLGSWVRVFDLGGRVTDLKSAPTRTTAARRHTIPSFPDDKELVPQGQTRVERAPGLVDADGHVAVRRLAEYFGALVRHGIEALAAGVREWRSPRSLRPSWLAEDIGTVAGNPRPGVVCCRHLAKPCSLAARRCHWILRS